MRDENGARLWREVEGVLGEAQRVLHVEASGLAEEIKADLESGASSKRARRALESAQAHINETLGRLTLGHVPQAATELAAAGAWLNVARMTDADHAAACDRAEASRFADPMPLVAALRRMADMVLGRACARRPSRATCEAEGEMRRLCGQHGCPDHVRDGDPCAARCLGARDGFHAILATVDRPACAGGRTIDMPGHALDLARAVRR